MDGLGLEFWNSSGVSMSELFKCKMLLKTVFVKSSELMRGKLVVNDGKGEEVRSEREINTDGLALRVG